MMKAITIILYIALSFINIRTAISQEATAVFDTIIKRIHTAQLAEQGDINLLDIQVEQYLKTIDQGFWSEYDYADHKRINPSWLPVLDRIHKMTIAYTHSQSRYHEKSKLWKAIQKSLYYFCRHEPLPYSDNWYHQAITRPQALALSLVNLKFGKNPLSLSVAQAVIRVICQDTSLTSEGRNHPMHKFNFGANKGQVAQGWVIIGALLGDQTMLNLGVREVYAPLKKGTGEGIQYDLSYDMHNGYLYNGSYGTNYMQAVIRTASYTVGTRYALQGEQLHLFRAFVQQSIFGLMRGNYLDWNVLGRAVSRRDALKRNYARLLLKMLEIDPAAAEDYRIIGENMANRLAINKRKSYHRHYWVTDYSVHIRPDYSFSIHGASARNHAQEIGNYENIQGFWGAAGTINLQLRGDEYYNIFPLWNWARLPGASLPDSIPILPNKVPGTGDRWGTSSFVGGLSDSLYGFTIYQMDNYLQSSSKNYLFIF